MLTTSTTNLAAMVDDLAVEFIVSQQGVIDLCSTLRSATRIAFDTETVVLRDELGAPLSLDVHGPGPLRAISIAASYPDGTTRLFVIDCAKTISVSDEVANVFFDGTPIDGDPVDIGALADEMSFLDVFAWNADFDEGVMERAGVRFAGWCDLMLVRALLRLGGAGVRARYALAQAAKRYLGVEVDGKGTVQTSFSESDPLNVEQIVYAAKDAKVTLDLADVLMGQVHEAGLDDVVELSRRARPFRAWMERSGIAFDVELWRSYLQGLQPKVDEIEGGLAAATGGGQASLFDPTERPMWKPASPDDVKRVLNTYAADAVQRANGALLAKEDSVDNAALERIGHPLAQLIIDWRELDKLRGTYGEKFIAHVRDDGRIHASYNQEQVGTGRLSSNGPNMQNIAPESKHCFRHPQAPRRDEAGNWNIAPDDVVLVMADLGQAELRAAGDLSGDTALIDAFAKKLDMHVVTASRMFGIDVAGLLGDDLAKAVVGGGIFAAPLIERVATEYGIEPSVETIAAHESARKALAGELKTLYSQMRSRGKTMNFAVIYGLGASSLADTLTRAGVPTSDKEARELQEKYFAAFEKMAAFLNNAEAAVKAEAKSLSDIDFAATIRLAKIHGRLIGQRSQLRKQTGHFPTNEELFAAVWPRHQIVAELERRTGQRGDMDDIRAEQQRLFDEMVWALGFDAAVVVRTDGTEYASEVRTVSGRRRLFNITADSWMLAVALVVTTSRQPHARRLVSECEQRLDVTLTRDDGSPLSRAQLVKRFENRSFRMTFVEHVLGRVNQVIAEAGGSWEGRDAATRLCYMALEREVLMLANAKKNAPVQGGVADAVMDAFGTLERTLRTVPGARPVQTVHDSIVIECAARDAIEVGRILIEALGDGMRRFFPNVEAAVDIEYGASLDSKRDGIDEDFFVNFAAR
jgi:DNA polymerase I-like protein with 3'-5' exonuclease and polymerase domains